MNARAAGATKLAGGAGAPTIEAIADGAWLLRTRKVASLDPTVVFVGHYGPITGDICAQLERAAEAP